MRKTKRSLAILLVALLVLLTATPALAAPAKIKIDYVAMGDSGAAGVLYGSPQYPLGGTAFGYTDNIARALKALRVLGTFDKTLTKAGKTAADLAMETADLSTPAMQRVHNAEIVTITIGANDLLGPFYNAVAQVKDIANPTEPEKLIVASAIMGIMAQLSDPQNTKCKEIQGNIKSILQNTLHANKLVRIYVMGYYNPLPVASKALGLDLNPFVDKLNACIRAAIKEVNAANKCAKITYVPTMKVMAKTPHSLVPVDIHPTIIGYQVIAVEFLKKILPDFR